MAACTVIEWCQAAVPPYCSSENKTLVEKTQTGRSKLALACDNQLLEVAMIPRGKKKNITRKADKKQLGERKSTQ